MFPHHSTHITTTSTGIQDSSLIIDERAVRLRLHFKTVLRWVKKKKKQVRQREEEMEISDTYSYYKHETHPALSQVLTQKTHAKAPLLQFLLPNTLCLCFNKKVQSMIKRKKKKTV